MSNKKTYYLPGVKPVLEALEREPRRILEIYTRANANSPESRRVAELCAHAGIPLKLRDNRFLDALCESGNSRKVAHQGFVALVSADNMVSIDELLRLALAAPLPLIIALDQARDPGNIGSISRAAYALGCAGLLVPSRNSGRLLGPGAMKSSAGALERLPCAEVVNLARALDEAAEQDFYIYGAAGDARNSENAFDVVWTFPAVLVLGGEENGIRPGVMKRCQTIVRVPFAREFDSLNIAQAGAILIGLIAAQRSRAR